LRCCGRRRADLRPHDGKAYDITGPEALGERDVAALYAELGGRPVEPVFLDDDAWVAAMVEHAGMPEPVAQTYATFAAATRRGYVAVVSSTVQDLTGRPPRTVREVLDVHRDELAGATGG
jgi:NAD(P)H dehydrogenase (quinone)